ncbi:MAG TPA: TauD/TfdA family dioxygenase [Ilumatobacteraceae bacterium]|nr:TauD/TfdA family dioxygenase [Ilumatobacteraceae bacterium]
MDPKVTAVAGALGARLDGVDLRQLSAGDVTTLGELLHHYQVVFFPGAHLSPDEHMDLARRFGEPSVFPSARMRGATEPSFQVITDTPTSVLGADSWHTDVTWTATPPRYALLHAEVVPDRGGDTMWASTTAAYDALHPAMQEMLDHLDVVHDNEWFLAEVAKKMPADQFDVFSRRIKDTYPPVVHPLVRTITETGKRALFSGGPFMKRVVGMSPLESDVVLDFVRRHVAEEQFQCRWRWSAGDLAIWDERSTNHRSAADYAGQHRSIRRCEIDGDRPYRA